MFRKKEAKTRKHRNKKNQKKSRFWSSRNMFSIENQMQGIPLARSPQEKKHKHMTQIKKRNKRKNEKHIKKENKENKEKRNTRKTKKQKQKTKRTEDKSPFCNFYPITAMEIMFGKWFPEIML